MADKVKFRYRGYYYDDETGFYYLQSRYYDPGLCRFISADQYELVRMLSQTLGQMNLYAYCNNNPIMYTDESGEGIFAVLMILVVSTFVGTAIGGVSGYLRGDTGWTLVKDIAIGASLGLAAGGVVLMLGGVSVGVVNWLGLTQISFLGISAKQAFAIGALAYDFTVFVVAPLLGLKMDPIEFNPSPYQPSKPGATPKHPYNKRKG